MFASWTVPSRLTCPLETRYPCQRTRGHASMYQTRISSSPAVLPSQVWAALAPDSQARVIELMACLASNFVSSMDGAIPQETPRCTLTSPLPRSGVNTSIALR